MGAGGTVLNRHPTQTSRRLSPLQGSKHMSGRVSVSIWMHCVSNCNWFLFYGSMFKKIKVITGCNKKSHLTWKKNITSTVPEYKVKREFIFPKYICSAFCGFVNITADCIQTWRQTVVSLNGDLLNNCWLLQQTTVINHTFSSYTWTN